MFIIMGGKRVFYCGREKSVLLWAGKERFIMGGKRVFYYRREKFVCKKFGRQCSCSPYHTYSGLYFVGEIVGYFGLFLSFSIYHLAYCFDYLCDIINKIVNIVTDKCQLDMLLNYFAMHFFDIRSFITCMAYQ